MKVCVFGTRGFPFIEGGVEKHCQMLYPMIGSDAEVTVFRRKPYVEKQTETVKYGNIKFVDLPSTKIKGVEAVVHSFLSAICAVCLRPDVVHIHNIGPALVTPLLKIFSIPVVLTYHSPNYEHKKWGKFAKKLLKFSENVALRYADRIIFVNEFQMQKYESWITDKSVYLPNGISKPELTTQVDFLERWGIEPGKYILSVGRITPEKGFHTLIDAFCQIGRDDIKLVIAGGVGSENEYMEQLRSMSAKAPVIFTGAVYGEALAQLYSNAGLYVLASENEGFPLVLLEAMSYRRNVLVSDIPATHLVDLEPADYFTVSDVLCLKTKIEEKLSQSSERIYALEEYDWEKISEQVSHIYGELIEPRRGKV